jgi:hypothetical protein
MLKIIILGLFFIKVNGISDETLDKFNEWIKKYNISVNNFSLSRILDNWIRNDNYINYINAQNLTYKLDHNIYSGYSLYNMNDFKGYNKEYDVITIKNYLIGLRGTLDYIELFPNKFYPKTIDWRDNDVVTNIKTQGACSSSWAFSAISSLESAYAIKNRKLLTFSEQYLIDCDNILKNGYDRGCDGGTVKNVYKWLRDKRLFLVEDYEDLIKTKTKSCNKTCNIINNTEVLKYVIIKPNSEDAMLTALSIQPVSVAIDASTRDFYLYSSGVFTASCGTNLNHAVNIVGYASNNYGDYYIIRNSWGTSWGDNGYMYLPRGNYNDGAGQCGVLMEGIYPILN